MKERRAAKTDSLPARPFPVLDIDPQPRLSFFCEKRHRCQGRRDMNPDNREKEISIPQ